MKFLLYPLEGPLVFDGGCLGVAPDDSAEEVAEVEEEDVVEVPFMQVDVDDH